MLTKSDRWSKVAHFTNLKLNDKYPNMKFELSSIQCKNRYNIRLIEI